ncbi:MAG: DUF4058 family protein [Planctomycetota bacterium]|nr:MAG: DUF4058 family protein [Planctomycetota bacterium]
MPSPFPGMDPFIEGQKWKGFHTRFIAAIGDALMPHVRPRYVVDVEEDIYLAKEDGTLVTIFVPEVSVVRGAGWMEDNDGGVAVAIEPTVFTLPMTEPLELPYLAIRRSDNEETVAIIELLSPTNKSSRDGRAESLAKRNSLLRSRAHLIEIDLLRGGERLPTVEPLSPGDYFAFVSRAERRPMAEVYAWPPDRSLPTIPHSADRRRPGRVTRFANRLHHDLRPRWLRLRAPLRPHCGTATE